MFPTYLGCHTDIDVAVVHTCWAHSLRVFHQRLVHWSLSKNRLVRQLLSFRFTGQ